MTHKAYLQDSYEDALRKNLELHSQLTNVLIRNDELQTQLELMTAQRNTWELLAHGSIEAIERIAATLDIRTMRPDSALGVSYAELEKLIIEAIEDMAE